ncbi:SDR family NAD(P)-dependent oxidoreductase [Bacillus sp. ISL-35]|uniref:SDR family oxidoreductase n=1 Tax=Bacillus sp. ISL-35 TaxID=2819122 RepID=UPI001BEA70DD|nr:SDR family NAD(P)-dependent oxidoreductase [Bacillus sp. ISL-35]MBT2679350.1 SDR family NAD(P)-dependent oxidoreductase [Bacillus sp. ISL-35]MBT2703249.1 SDR family NAD(P)-dependent oxidoreductase [Chryseobacterium sp. ISL-80]
MRLSGNTILITGGAAGIGFAFAERFIKAGNKVIICGRRESKLQEAKEKYPELITRVCDVTKETDRIALFDWVTSEHPDVNVLVNNAGIQQRYNVLKTNAKEDWNYYSQEIASNIEAPFHFCMLFGPHFAIKDYSAILNVSSGLAFTPMAIAPIYSATKAAVHSFTVSLRHQLEDTSIEVIEVAPPAVNTDLGGAGLHSFATPVDEFAGAIFKGLEAGETEIGYARSESARKMSRDEIDESVRTMYENMKNTIL